jgi:membrane protein DedA with SNARE-associated domain
MPKKPSNSKKSIVKKQATINMPAINNSTVEKVSDSFYKKNKRVINFIIFMVIFLFILILMRPLFLKAIQINPELYETYKFVQGQLDKNSMLWLYIITSIGALFFISIPSDLILVYYIISGANPFLTIIVYFAGHMSGRTIDYGIGFSFSKIVTERVLKDDYDNFSKKFSKWEASLLFFGNLIPFPNEFFCAFVGTIKYNYWKFLLFNGAGKLLKIIIIVMFLKYFLLYNTEFLTFDFFEFVKNLLELLLPVA